MNDLLGFRIYASQFATKQVWVFPADRFVEYGPEDEWWAIKCGFGHWEDKPCAVQIGQDLIMHPSLIEAIRRKQRGILKV
jgi:hypothetical protein